MRVVELPGGWFWMHDLYCLRSIDKRKLLLDVAVRPIAARRAIFHAAGTAREFNAATDLVDRDEQFPTVACRCHCLAQEFLTCFRHSNPLFL